MRRIDVAATPYELTLVESMELYAAVVIDALRATTTITTALANHSTRILPVATTGEAEMLKKAMPKALLAGERRGAKISGYDLGNSPQEHKQSIVGGREIIFTTSNGTPTLVACEKADPVYVACFLNRRTVAQAIARSGRDILIACSGHHGKLAAEDLACAGAVIAAVQQAGSFCLTDGAHAALALYNTWQDRISQLLAESYSGRNIAGLGYISDIGYCAQLDTLDILPLYRRGEIIPCLSS